MSAGAFGAAVYRDRDFVPSLRDGRCPRLRTVDRALAAMGEPPAGPAFLGEVEAFLAVTGVKRSLLGRDATGNPSFVAQLLGGVSPKLATVEAVRARMKSHASAAEWREIRARSGAMPAILTDAPLPSPRPPARPADHDPEPEGPAGGDMDQCYFDTLPGRPAAAPLTVELDLSEVKRVVPGPVRQDFPGRQDVWFRDGRSKAA